MKSKTADFNNWNLCPQMQGHIVEDNIFNPSISLRASLIICMVLVSLPTLFSENCENKRKQIRYF